MSQRPQNPIIILGAGIIGLTTAVRLLESPLYRDEDIPVHIIADHLPNDPLDARYASTIAGAHHLSFADDEDERQRRWDGRTFEVMFDEWKNEGEATGLMAVKQTEMFVGHDKHLKIYEEHPDFKIVEMAERPKDIDHAVSFTSLTMTPLTYLNRLLQRISHLSEGKVRIHRYHIPSLSSLTEPSVQTLIGKGTPLAVVVCVGLGALTLGGVEDKTVFPTRGQVIKVKAPWIKTGWTRQVGDLNGGEGGERTYVIPRADGEVILGGTREEGGWEAEPRQETTQNILRRVLEICPELTQGDSDHKHPVSNQSSPDLHNPTSTDVSAIPTNKKERQTQSSRLQSIIMDNLVGFRPSREGGTRVERGPDLSLTRSVGSGKCQGEGEAEGEAEGEKTVVVYNYGHGGAGWQSCWGTAEDAIALLEAALQ
ncbi:uncharacterized protein I303_106501 [Kwoniella dejecticola CBS 10117]|uniref:D-aspartate oxidase n=1 Tax=Kwoniella dejecticola CBS 10117 TaxID=1296121 RepID=A0A1A5ZUI8_9TREE|nr:D-aspartate oxidase [Kwoniella dejecticola CBS 10117]OBR81471.1 D-aspartate oxidase [Kwoniella dejecticola CBS 10117]